MYALLSVHVKLQVLGRGFDSGLGLNASSRILIACLIASGRKKRLTRAIVDSHDEGAEVWRPQHLAQLTKGLLSSEWAIPIAPQMTVFLSTKRLRMLVPVLSTLEVDACCDWNGMLSL
eukprot:5392554-Pleurochrysis_carterae.AAC.1